MQIKAKILWGLFFLNLGAMLASLLSGGHEPVSLALFLPVFLLFLHSIWTLSFFRGIAFILLAFFMGFVSEFVGLKYGWFFGGDYAYSPGWTKIFYGVPLSVILYWGIFIYFGYCLTNSFLYWLNRDKPSKDRKNGFLLLPLIFLDGLIVTAIDLFMDPLQVKMGGWAWLDGGSYFGVPLGNFIGWFVVVIISTGVFRVYEYIKPKELSKELKTVFIIPVLGYGAIYFAFLISAINLKMMNLALVGSLAMLPIVIVNLGFLRKSKIINKF